jgi:hypothetical protein
MRVKKGTRKGYQNLLPVWFGGKSPWVRDVILLSVELYKATKRNCGEPVFGLSPLFFKQNRTKANGEDLHLNSKELSKQKVPQLMKPNKNTYQN